ncbi:acyltransferase, partial [Pseudomonas aeruginosa]|nr:acyltransferase [Pseudomonas aeruginosa]
LAALSLYYVEAPFRERKLFAGRRQMLGAALCSLLLLGVVGQLVRHYDGVPSRLSEEALRYAKASKWRDGQTDCMFDKKALSQESICRFPAELAAERPLLVSWGDSHSAALSPLLRELATSRRLPIWQASLAGCPPLLGMLEKDTCLRFNQQMLEFVEQQRPGGVILAGRWDMYIYGDSQDGTRNILREPDDTPDSSIAEALLRQRLSGMIERLNAADVHVWLVKDVPLLPFKAPARLVRLSLSGEDVGRARFPFAEHAARVAYVNALFDALAEGNPRVSVLDPSSVLCDGLDCFAERDGWSLYMDNNHLSTQGAHELGPLFEPMLQSLDDSRIASQQ